MTQSFLSRPRSGLRDADDVGISGRPNAGTLLSRVSSRSQKARQPPLVVGPLTFALSSLPLRIHAAASGSDPLRLGQGDANSRLRITSRGESSLTPFSLQPLLHNIVQFSRGLPPCLVVNVCAEMLERCPGSSMTSEKTAAFTNSHAPHAKRISPLPARLRILPPEQLHPTARPTHSQLAGNC